MTNDTPLTVAIVGPGAVGSAFALRLARTGTDVRIRIVGRDAGRAQAAVARLGVGEPVGGLDLYDPQDAVALLTVGDDDLADAAAALAAQLDPTGPLPICIHVSGAAPLAALDALRARGASVAALHPILAITDPERAAAAFGEAAFTLQADAATRSALAAFLDALGVTPVDLPDTVDRALYHAALVFMSNYACTLVDAGLACLEACGVERDAGARLTAHLAATALEAAFRDGPARALTGPIARGDVDTVARHRAALAGARPELGALYDALGAATVGLAERKGAADPARLQRIRAAFSTNA